jgi:hypothetical protein
MAEISPNISSKLWISHGARTLDMKPSDADTWIIGCNGIGRAPIPEKALETLRKRNIRMTDITSVLKVCIEESQCVEFEEL